MIPNNVDVTAFRQRRNLLITIVKRESHLTQIWWDTEMMGKRGGEVCKLAMMPDLPLEGTNSNSGGRHRQQARSPLKRCHYSSWGHYKDSFPPKIF